MKITLGSDHAGFAMRRFLAVQLAGEGHVVLEVGAKDESSYDYPDASDLVAEAVLVGSAELGILVCGPGIGVSIRANRHHGIRAALCTNEMMARLARQHNHANVICLGGRVIAHEAAAEVIHAYLAAFEDPGPRHAVRIEKLDRPVAEEIAH